MSREAQDEPEYAHLTPAARAYLKASAAAEQAMNDYLLGRIRGQEGRERIADAGEARRAAYLALSPEEQEAVGRALGAVLQRQRRAIEEAQ